MRLSFCVVPMILQWGFFTLTVHFLLESKLGATRSVRLAVLKCRLCLACCCLEAGLSMEEAAQAAAAQLAGLVDSSQVDQRSPDLRRMAEV